MKFLNTCRIPLLAACTFWPSCAQAADTKVVSIRLAPERASLWGTNASQRFLVLAKYDDGLERDVSDNAQLSISSTGVGRIDKTRVVALADGKATLNARFMGRSAVADLTISGMAEKRPFSFSRDIGGILTKRGCNSTTCHG